MGAPPAPARDEQRSLQTTASALPQSPTEVGVRRTDPRDGFELANLSR
jgi:hypothetical protein